MAAPSDRNGFEIAIMCALPLEFDALSLLFDQFWDTSEDRYGRVGGDANIYRTGRIGKSNIVLVLLPGMGNVDAAGATASLRTSYPRVQLTILAGICGGVPFPEPGEEIILGDVIVSKTVFQYDFGREYPDGFKARNTIEDGLGCPTGSVRTLLTLLETKSERTALHSRSASLLEIIQEKAKDGHISYHYPGTANDKLFPADYRHRHHLSQDCICAKYRSGHDPVCEPSRKLSCLELGCDDGVLVARDRLHQKAQLELAHRSMEAQKFAIFIGRVGSSNKVLKSAEDRDHIARQHGLLAFEMEGVGVWKNTQCLIVKGVCDYADSHKNKNWQNFAAATAACVARAIIERYPRTDPPPLDSNTPREDVLDRKENRACMRDLRVTDPRDDKSRIEQTKGGLLRDSYCWVLDHADFQQWRDDPASRLLWIKGDPGKGKTMLMCGIIDEIEKSAIDGPLTYFFCQATQDGLNNASAVLRGLIYMLVEQKPSLVSHIRPKYDKTGRSLFDDHNAFTALSAILQKMLDDPVLGHPVLMIDALDECVHDLPLLLELIIHACSSTGTKWLVTSRGLPSIETKLGTFSDKMRLSLELNERSVSAAVQSYIRQRTRILAREKDYDQEVSHMIETYLTSNANGTFLWVALVCQELAGLNVRKRHIPTKLKEFPAGLYPLYNRMLSLVLDSIDATVCREILSIALVTYRPLSLAELACLAGSVEKEDIEDIISRCGSFLTVKAKTIYFVHQSASDFLKTEASDQLHFSMKDQHYRVFVRSLALLEQSLRRNIYNLKSPGTLLEEIIWPEPDPLEAIRYSCVFWIDHLVDSAMRWDTPTSDCQKIRRFFEQKFLNWIEALALSESLSSVRGIDKLFWMASKLSTVHILTEALLYFSMGESLIWNAPLQVYASALLFLPPWSLIRQLYQKDIPTWATSEIIMGRHYRHDYFNSSKSSSFRRRVADALLRIKEACGIQMPMRAPRPPGPRLDFSHDGNQLACWSKPFDYEELDLKIWDASKGPWHRSKTYTRTGVALQSTHQGLILLDYTRDEQYIKVWNTSTHARRTLKDPDDGISWAMCSDDGNKLLTKSPLGVVKIWDIISGLELARLQCLDLGSDVLALSKNGKLLVCRPPRVPYQPTVTVWDLTTGVRCCALATEGYLASFSRDDHWLAVASKSDITIWQIPPGICTMVINEGSISLNGEGSISRIAFDKAITSRLYTNHGCLQLDLPTSSEGILTKAVHPQTYRYIGYRICGNWIMYKGQRILQLPAYRTALDIINIQPSTIAVVEMDSHHIEDAWLTRVIRFTESAPDIFEHQDR